MATPVNQPSAVHIFETLNAYRESGALKTAIELAVFTAIAGGASTAQAIASECGASERGIRILCDTLVVGGLLEKDNGRYRNTPDGALFLDRNSPLYIGTISEFLCGPEIMTGYLERLTDSVRKGGTTLPGEGSVSHENPIWVKFARSMAPIMIPAAHAIAGHLPPTEPLKVLDIAAGHGMFGVTIASRNPQAEITALDWAPVLQVAKENAEKASVSSRYRTIEGSAFDVDFGSGYDAVLVTNFLHHFDAATNEKFLRKVHAALKPGGKAVTLEFGPNEDRVSPPTPARFALTMLNMTQGGDAYTFSELDTMFRNAGFASSEQHMLETQQSVIISTK